MSTLQFYIKMYAYLNIQIKFGVNKSDTSSIVLHPTFVQYILLNFVSEGLQNLGLFPAHMAFKQEWILLVRHKLWHKALIFAVSFVGSAQFSHLLQQAKGTEDLFYRYPRSPQTDTQ